MAGRANQSFVVVFVEGETDFQFFTKLLEYYEQNSSSSIRRYKIVQMNPRLRQNQKQEENAPRSSRKNIECKNTILNEAI